uniref:TATA element modulatory factor 1 TATA binding domain-containing protein n=1 Tax=Setaria digitata TaxID=48799 RepID=A0A915PTU0_9BILA
MTIEKLNERAQQVEQQNFMLELNSKKLLSRVEDLTKALSGKEDEISRVYARLNEETDAMKKRIAQKQNELDEAKKYSEALEKELHKPRNQGDECLIEPGKVDDPLTNDHPFMLNIPNHVVQILNPFIRLILLFIKIELADALTKYEQSMRQISVLEEKISSMETEIQYLGVLRHELQALRLRYENLLEAHGEKIERVEELELDLADVKKLLKDQEMAAEQIQNSSVIFLGSS